MLQLQIIQAQWGDCLLLQHESGGTSTHLLVDGGPKSTFGDALKPILEGIRGDGGRLAAIVVSHVDDDHIKGILDLVNDIAWARNGGRAETICFDEVWHNSFSATIGNDVRAGVGRAFTTLAASRAAAPNFCKSSRDIAQGDELTRLAEGLGVPVNQRFAPSRIICSDDLAEPVALGELSLHVVGPGQQELENLRRDWLAWIEEQKAKMAAAGPGEAARTAAELDESVPNLSSIMFLAEADGKRILFTGDGLAVHLLDGLRKAGLLDASGKLHVDVLKLPHHGSKYNMSREFLQAVTADHYIISASGNHGHPHLPTLRWVVETARDQGRHITLWATKETKSIRDLKQQYPPVNCDYEVLILPANCRVHTLRLT